MEDFQWELPCDPTDMVYFSRRIGGRVNFSQNHFPLKTFKGGRFVQEQL
jgi:hypothetical protein